MSKNNLVALISDTHFGARNNNEAFSDYQYRFYNDVFFPYIEKHKIKKIIHLGDLVDKRKNIDFVTLNRMRNDFVGRIYEMGIELHLIVGNHDTAYKSTNKVNAARELFTWSKVKIYEETAELLINGTKFIFVPWMNPENFDDSMEMINESEAEILCGHLEINGAPMMLGGTKSEFGVSERKFSKFEMALSGHFHHRNLYGSVQYLGSPYEFTWADCSDPKGFHVLDTDKMSLDFVENPHQMFKKIYYDDCIDDYYKLDLARYKGTVVKLIVSHKSNFGMFDDFIDRLFNAELIDLKIIEEAPADFVNVDDMDINVDSTSDMLAFSVDKLDELVYNKKRMRKTIGEIYSEAVNLG